MKYGMAWKPSRAPLVHNISVGQLKVGMVLVEDMLTSGGVLLAAKGYKVTESFRARMENLKQGGVKEPIKVIVVDEP
jgi:hypothetical protein